MSRINELNKQRADLEVKLQHVRQEIAALHGHVDDPSDREGIPVPGHDKANPPPDPSPDPEIDPETGRAVGDETPVHTATKKTAVAKATTKQ